MARPSSTATLGVALSVAGMGALCAGFKLSALSLFGAGVKLLEKDWRARHPEFVGNAAERWQASLGLLSRDPPKRHEPNAALDRHPADSGRRCRAVRLEAAEPSARRAVGWLAGRVCGRLGAQLGWPRSLRKARSGLQRRRSVVHCGSGLGSARAIEIQTGALSPRARDAQPRRRAGKWQSLSAGARASATRHARRAPPGEKREASVRPHPIGDLGSVVAVLVRVARVLDDGVPHLFLQVRRLGPQPRHAIDHVDHEMEA